MRLLRRLRNFSLRFIRQRKLIRIPFHRARQIRGEFYVSQLDDAGVLSTSRVCAQRLVLRDGKLYLCGWCEVMPAYRQLDVERITQIADDDSNEIVMKCEVRDWLARKSRL